MNEAASEAADLFYEPLISNYLDAPGTVARDWLLEEIQKRFERPSCRFVLLTGEPGAGKTGFMAALARRHPDWLRYFIRLDSVTPLSGSDAESLFLRIGHQLAHGRPELFDPDSLKIEVEQRIERAGPGAKITGIKIEDLYVSPFLSTAMRVRQHLKWLDGGLGGVEIARARIEPRLLQVDTLSHLALLDPARLLARKAPEDRVVVLIDALDETSSEAGRSSIMEWLQDFAATSPNIRFVLSSRPGDRLRLLESVRGAALEIVQLDPESPQVRRDVRVFVTSVFDETRVLAQRPAIVAERAITSLVDAAQGNFAYLTAYARTLRAAVAAGIPAHVDDLLEFESLPSGLPQLYAAFARRMRQQIEKLGQLEIESPQGGSDVLVPAWEGTGRRILGVLAVAFAPLSLQQIVKFGGIRVWESASRDVLNLLRPFLDELESGWRLFHPSLADFLKSAATHDAADVAIDGREWHARIVRYFRGSGSWADVDWRRMDPYGMLHVAEHIAASDDDPAAAVRLVTSNLRVASKERFFSDLPFSRLVRSVRRRVVAGGKVADALTSGIFLQQVLWGLHGSAGLLDPAAYGLMARLGRVDEALARADVLAPGLRKFRSFEAIWKSTPAELRSKLGALDGVERLVGIALDVPATAGPLVGMLGYELSICLREAAVAMAAHDFDRAMQLAETANKHERVYNAVDQVLAAAALAAPERALELVSRISEKPLEAAVDAAERSAAGPGRDGLVEFAMVHLDDESSSSTLPLVARLFVLTHNRVAQAANHALLRARLEKAASNKPTKDSASSSDLWGVVRAAELVHAIAPELAARLLKKCDRKKVDSLLADALVNAAAVWVSLGEVDVAKGWLEKALGAYRELGWYGPARDIARASRIAALFDRQIGETLAEEAMALVEPIVQQAYEEDDSRIEGILAGMVRSFRDGDRARALKVARWMRGGWIHGGDWDSTDGRGALAVIGLDVADSDPGLARQLLAECLEGADNEIELGRSDPRIASSRMFTVVARPRATGRAEMNRQAFNATLVSNSASYWTSGRKWRYFQTPADVLRSVDDVFPISASWARAVAAAVQPLARLDFERAMTLPSWLSDPCERLVALAGLAGLLAEGDRRLPDLVQKMWATVSDLPHYQGVVDVESLDIGPILAYLDPALRACFEASRLIPSMSAHRRIMPPRNPYTSYLHLAQDADVLFEQLLCGVFSGLEVEDLERQIDEVSGRFAKSDPMIRDLFEVAGIVALAAKDSARARRSMERIAHPSQRARARLLVLPGEVEIALLPAEALQLLSGLADEVPPLHRAELTAVAARICSDAGQGVEDIARWGVAQLEPADPLSQARGYPAIAPYLPIPQRVELLSRGLRAAENIGNEYIRRDALSAMLPVIVDTGDGQLVSRCLDQISDAFWSAHMEALRRAMPSIISVAGSDIIERMDVALRCAQMVLAPRAHANKQLRHLDGVLSEPERPLAVLALAESQRSIAAYLDTYLDQDDVGPSLPCVQDSRISGPDPGDEPFERLHGRASGLSAWQADAGQSIWRIVDIRFLFDNEADAAAYHKERLIYNSEGHPQVPNAPSAGEECYVFGGTGTFEHSGFSVTMTTYYFVFRVGRVVAKLFVAQGTEATEPLTPERVLGLARRIVERIRNAGLVEESSSRAA